MKGHRRRRISWSQLPPDLLLAIAERLECRDDILHFRRACKTWRASAPLSLLTSKNILSPILPHTLSDESGRSYSKVLVANSVFLIRSTVNPKLPPWLFSVEELDPGMLSVRSPLSRSVTQDLPEDFPYELDLSHFNVLELGRFHTYRFVDNPASTDEDSGVLRYYSKPDFPLGNKVVLFVNPNCQTSPSTVDDCTVVELSNHVALSVKRLKDGEKKLVYFRGRKLDDIITFEGKIYAIDRKGRVCSMDYHSLKMLSIAEDPLCEGSGSDNKKRLAVSCGELYLVYTRWCRNGSVAFKVFKLNEEEQKWDKLEGIGNDRILFVTFDGCFFASTKDFPGWRGNCIVSPKGSFPRYSDTGVSFDIFKPVSKYIVVYDFEGGDCGPLDCYSGYYDVLWPPPSWIWTEEEEDEEEEEEEEEEVEGEGDEEDKGGEEETPPNHVQVVKGIQNVQEDIAHEEFKDQNNVDSALAMNSSLKIAEKDVSQLKFLGVEVSSHLVPILQKIWDKHGNIMEGHVVNSDSLLTWALESLAKTIIILQNGSGSSLDDSQAKYLESVLLDFRLMHFKVDWLVPFVEKALALHKNRVIMELETTKSKLQTELREIEERLAAQGKLVPESQLVSLDLKDVLN